MSSVKFMNTIGKLASVKRYSDFRMVNEESVLEHTAFVGMMSYFIAESLMKENKLEIDVKILLEKALMHDIDEVATGDIAMPVKYYSESLRSMIGEMEDEDTEEQILEMLEKRLWSVGIKPNKESTEIWFNQFKKH